MTSDQVKDIVEDRINRVFLVSLMALREESRMVPCSWPEQQAMDRIQSLVLRPDLDPCACRI